MCEHLPSTQRGKLKLQIKTEGGGNSPNPKQFTYMFNLLKSVIQWRATDILLLPKEKFWLAEFMKPCDKTKVRAKRNVLVQEAPTGRWWGNSAH